MFVTKHYKTVNVPNDLKQRLEIYCQKHPNLTVHALMLQSIKLGLDLLDQPKPPTRSDAVDR